MPVVNSKQDLDSLTFTIVTDLAAPPARVWQIWSDARQLERWWGPPTWPATFDEHDLSVGGGSRYYMTGPEGEKERGWWKILELEEAHSLEFDDGFSHESGEPDDSMPVIRAQVELEETPTGTRMTINSRFATLEQMQKVLEMGMVEGMTEAMGQIDAVIAT